MLDDPDTIRRKFRRAVTDSEAKVCRREDKPGGRQPDGDLRRQITGHTYDQIEAEFDGRGYGDFKAAVGEAVVAVLAPIQERFRTWMADKAQLDA